MTVSDDRTVLLTGATGFVGRQVLRTLLREGCRVRVVVRSGRGDQLPQRSSQLEVVETNDLFRESRDGLAAVVDGVDTIAHVAWYAEPGKYLLSPLNLDCLRGTVDLAQVFAESSGKRFVGVGTCFEYDFSTGYLPVTTPLRPATPYASCKAAAYLALSAYLENAGVEFAWCRLFYLYGEGEDGRRLVPYLRARMEAGQPAEMTSGDQVRDYLDVRVAGERIAGVVTSSVVGPVNICSGIPITIRAMAEKVADEYGGRHLLRWGARPDNLTDPPVIVGVADGASVGADEARS